MAKNFQRAWPPGALPDLSELCPGGEAELCEIPQEGLDFLPLYRPRTASLVHLEEWLGQLSDARLRALWDRAPQTVAAQLKARGRSPLRPVAQASIDTSTGASSTHPCRALSTRLGGVVI